jgi:FAD/FMN-containing dehydrogenase
METLLFSFDRFSGAHGLTGSIFETSLLPAAVEVMNRTLFTNLKIDRTPDFVVGPYVVAIALEAFAGAVNRMANEIMHLADTHGAQSHARLRDHPHLQFWLAVSNLDATLAMKFAHLIKAKLNYNISDWKEIFEFVDHTLSQEHLEHTISAHAGCGICSLNLLLDRSDNGSADKAVKAMDQFLKRSREGGGNLVIHHAPPDLKKRLKIWGELPLDFAVMKRVKEALDPSAIMSPGRFVGGL